MTRSTNRVIHCSYHKCLTAYYRRVFRRVCVVLGRPRSGYHHFRSDLAEFEDRRADCYMASVNNHALDLGAIGDDIRISRFVRDPRDLVVSGYFYHLRGGEPWTNTVDPEPGYFSIVNGVRPADLRSGESLSTMLQRLPLEDGLRAEMELRAPHFESMRVWPVDDQRILTLRYEDVLGQERAAFGALARHYGLPYHAQRAAVLLAVQFAAGGRRPKRSHVRDPMPAQWRTMFTPDLLDEFESRWGDVLDRHGYERAR